MELPTKCDYIGFQFSCHRKNIIYTDYVYHLTKYFMLFFIENKYHLSHVAYKTNQSLF